MLLVEDLLLTCCLWLINFSFFFRVNCMFKAALSSSSTNTVSEFHSFTLKRHRKLATASEGLAQGPYVAARAGFELATLRTKGDESTNEPPHPTSIIKFQLFCIASEGENYAKEIICVFCFRVWFSVHWGCANVSGDLWQTSGMRLPFLYTEVPPGTLRHSKGIRPRISVPLGRGLVTRPHMPIPRKWSREHFIPMTTLGIA